MTRQEASRGDGDAARGAMRSQEREGEARGEEVGAGGGETGERGRSVRGDCRVGRSEEG